MQRRPVAEVEGEERGCLFCPPGVRSRTAASHFDRYVTQRHDQSLLCYFHLSSTQTNTRAICAVRYRLGWL
ncbi:hypothetical protein V5799_019215 [Amblyomma americanum]|uniref:Uncharacterized protein n=1 Tax=Amblyomma americanum TaxID=6943 RepID=A0AAQ4EY28_AMBAM